MTKDADDKDRCTVSFADAETGIFTGRVFRGTRRLLALNTPPGCIAVDGRHDPRTSRVDLATGQVVRYEAAPDHEAEARARRRRLKRRIASLEQRELRPLAVTSILRARSTLHGHSGRSSSRMPGACSLSVNRRRVGVMR